jgi:type II secretory pathway component PulF
VTTLLAAHRAVGEAKRRASFYRSWGLAYETGVTHLTDLKRPPDATLEPFERALLALGEETGSLDRSLRLLGDWYEGQHKLLRKLWAKSAYPLFLTLFAAVTLPLPAAVLGNTNLYLSLSVPGVLLWWFFGGALVYLPARFAAGRGKWVRARLARAIATAMEAGAPLDRVIDLAVAAAANAELKRCVERVPPGKRRTQPLSQTFKGCPHVPAELLGAMQVAESSGNWHNSVGRMGELYEDGF